MAPVTQQLSRRYIKGSDLKAKLKELFGDESNYRINVWSLY